MQSYKSNIVTPPIYNDGPFRLYEIQQADTNYPEEFLKDTELELWYEEISISDKLRYESEYRNKKIENKIRIPQNKEITSLHVVKIGDRFFKVFSAYHFINKKNGFPQTDLTLEVYANPKLEASK